MWLHKLPSEILMNCSDSPGQVWSRFFSDNRRLALEVEIAIAKLKRYKSLGSDQIPAGGEILRSETQRVLNSVWSKEEFAWEVEVVYYCTNLREGRKTDCNNYRGVSLSSTSYKIVSNILLLIP
jgi:hypothetical protein